MEKEKHSINTFYLVVSVFLWVFTVAWMVIIFMLSSDSGVESSEKSAFAVSVFYTYLKLIIPEVIIRKLFHIFEFSVLSIMIFLSSYSTNNVSETTTYKADAKSQIKTANEFCILISLWISGLYATFDEYHQLFVNGRNGSVMDVLFDLIGIVATLIIIRFIISISLMKDKS